MTDLKAAIGALLAAPRRHLPWPSPGVVLIGAAAAVCAVLLTMALIDPTYLAHVRSQPAAVIVFFHRITDLGLGGWFLWPTGVLLLALALLDRASLSRTTRAVAAAIAARAGFIFLAIALPGIFINIAKHIIGRARPFVVDHNVWAYKPFTWPAAYAAMPSGHTTTVFAALVAIGELWPRLRPVMWVYALMIAASRVSIWAHHPSDVLAGAIIGTIGALMVRHWFAVRGLAFTVDPAGHVRPLPGPSWTRIKRVAARLAAA